MHAVILLTLSCMHDFIVNPYCLGDFTAAATGLGEQQFNEINTPCGNLYGALLHGRETAARGPIQGELNISVMGCCMYSLKSKRLLSLLLLLCVFSAVIYQ